MKIVAIKATAELLCGVWLLNESTCLNESSESMIQWLVHKDSDLTRYWMNQPFERIESMIQWLVHKDSHLTRYWMNPRVRMNRVSQWFSDSFIRTATWLVSEWIHVFERIEWINDSVTRS